MISDLREKKKYYPHDRAEINVLTYKSGLVLFRKGIFLNSRIKSLNSRSLSVLETSTLFIFQEIPKGA